jgi:hypothetical protein
VSGVERGQGVAVVRSSMFPNSFARWYPGDVLDYDGQAIADDPTHIAYEVNRAEAMERVIEAASEWRATKDGNRLWSALAALDALTTDTEAHDA